MDSYFAVYSDSDLTRDDSFAWSELIGSLESWDTFNCGTPISATQNPIEFVGIYDTDPSVASVVEQFSRLDPDANITSFVEYDGFDEDYEVWSEAYGKDASDYHGQSPFINYYFVGAPIDLVKREVELANAFGAKATFVEGTVLAGMPIYCMRLTIWTGDQYYPLSDQYQLTDAVTAASHRYGFTYLYA